MAKWRRVLLIGLLLLGPPIAALKFALARNAALKADMDKFSWLASNSAPEGCLMQIIEGSFYYRGGGSIYIPPRSLNNGWGLGDSVHVVGPDKKPIPDEMSIVFYSFLEDKFYRGTFQLSYDRIKELFAKGYRSYDPGAQPDNTYSQITAGVAPGGVVAVWVEGLSRRTEVFFGYAQEFDGDWQTLMRMPRHRRSGADARESELAEATESDPLIARYREKIPFGAWETYRTLYAWNPVFEGMEAPHLVEQIDSFNGEKDYLRIPVPPDLLHVPRPVPKHIDFVAQRPGFDHKTWFQFDFDEDEIFDAFKRLSAGAHTVSFVFRRGQRNGKFVYDVALRNSDTEMALTKTTVALNRAADH